ncbi:MAG: T9SS type A sorting domain-containing protein [Muribaculaceae bacterium]
MKSIEKRIGAAALMLTAVLSASAFDAIYVRQTSGDTKIALADLKEIAFLDEGVSVVTTDGSSLYGYDTFCSLRFNQNHSGGVTEVVADAAYSFDGNVLEIPGSESVSVYSFDGRLVLDAAGTTADVRQLPVGIYLVKAGNVTFKIVKR